MCLLKQTSTRSEDCTHTVTVLFHTVSAMRVLLPASCKISLSTGTITRNLKWA